MPRFKPKGMLERTATEDLWKHTLLRIPTIYGRLAYLASLRDSNTGSYRHHGFTAAFGREESGRAFRESHERVFIEWVKLPLSDKHKDLTEYLAGLEDPKQVVVAYWLRSRSYRNQPPATAREMERQHFFADLEALLETLRNGLPDAERFQPSSPLA